MTDTLVEDAQPHDEAEIHPPQGRRPRWWFVALGALAVLGLTLWWATRPEPADDRMLVVDEAGAISLLDPGTGEVVFEVPDAVASPDRSTLLTTSDADEGTALESRDPHTGVVTGSTTLEVEDLTVRTVSPQGGAVALMPGPRGKGIYEPESRERTSLTVSYLDERESRTYELEGNIEPEMFSYDESGLFVLDFDPPDDPDSYFVRRLDLADGTLSDTGAPEVGLNPKMRGRARASVLHPDGDQLFTLYTLPQDGEPVYDVEAGDDTPRYAFIHVIDLKTEESYCIFLPEPIGTVEEATVGMGIAPDGGEVIVADPSTSTMARVDTAELAVIATTRVGALWGRGDGQAVVAVAADRTVYVGSGPRLIELSGLDIPTSREWDHGTSISGLSLSNAGDQLRVGGEGSVTLLDRATGAESGVLSAPGRGTVSLLGPPGGSVVQYPIVCAC